MSVQVNCFDDRKAEAELKKCPKIVRDYVKLLKESNERWQQLTNKAISKMREEAKNISSNPVLCDSLPPCAKCQMPSHPIFGAICLDKDCLGKRR